MMNSLTPGGAGRNARAGKGIGGVASTVSQGTQSMSGSQMAGKGKMAAGMGKGSMMSGLGSAAQILAVGAAILMLAKALDIFADAMIKLETVDPMLLVGVGTGLLVFVGAMALIGASGIGWVGVAVMLAVGGALLMIGGAVWLAASGMATLVDSFTNMFSTVGDGGTQLFMAGAGFMMMAAGLGVLTMSLIALSMSSLLLLPALGILGALTALVVGTANALDQVNFGEMVDGINNLNTENIEALKDLASILNQGKPIEIKFSDIDGEIKLVGADGTDFGSIKEQILASPTFIQDLKIKLNDMGTVHSNSGS
jgi:hypothetical protein